MADMRTETGSMTVRERHHRCATEYAGSALQDLRNYIETGIVEEARRG